MRKSMRSHISDCEKLYENGAGRRPTTHHRVLYNSVWMFVEAGVESILDVGCGCGLTLRSMIGHSFRAMGTEICPSLLEGDLKGMDVYPYSIDDLSNIEDDEFDLVLGVDLIASLRDKIESDLFLSHARRISRSLFVTLKAVDIANMVLDVERVCGESTYLETRDGECVGIYFIWESR
jgi:2-polyprenyl-3-methyl-5-hydroxy-6-metoxy-1,4-benzoquinol methylase